ncbi:MAG: hypothetical protein ACE5PT_00945 [Gemmatimonadales bacterium]
METESVQAAASPVPEKRAVIPPAVLAARMQRYSLYMMVIAFLIILVNVGSLKLETILWFASGLAAGFAIMCAISVTILNAIAWNFDRLKEELRGGRQSTDLR